MRKLALFILLLFTGILFNSSPTQGHAGVVSTSPAQNEVLNAMPAEIKIVFSEDLLTIAGEEVNTISLTAFDGPPVEISEITVAGTQITAVVPAGEYAAGVYEVVYRIVSADGHKVSDSFTFSLNAPVLISEVIVEEGDGVIPAPIAGAIAIVVTLGGYLALRANKRKS